jgi:hypothetical protein
MLKKPPATAPKKTLHGQALLADMARFRKEVTSSPDAARAFLKSIGVLSKSGKRKTLIRE